MKKLFKIILTYIKQTDIYLWFLCLGLSAFSLLLISGIAYSGVMPEVGLRKVLVQCAASGLGALTAVFMSKIDYHTMGRLWKIHVPAVYFLVLLTFIIGTQRMEGVDDKAWLSLPFGLSIQPAELLKISFIITFAYHLFRSRERLNAPQNVLLLCIHGAIPTLLVHLQGDDGTALVFAIIFVCMMFAAGLSWKYIVPAFLALGAALPLVWTQVMSNDQKMRILALFQPDKYRQGIMYQQYNAKLAIGSGKVWGKGIFTPDHKYVPEMHNDFIFSFIGESLGFVGCLAVVVVIILLCIKLLLCAGETQDLQGKLICVGVFAMIAFQSIINIGMCLSLLPVIGITLPFLSSGGTSVLASYMGIGLVLSVYMHGDKNLFSQ
ncbi:FtsW/RodA/SpoVE family cell cycle protein [Youxingia wuxianensis]|uniref:FtsW/RodA/SpoVE family cell cycle protein n=1 Tax=Youxingia wuxianensis TaxID=2763678 RepID=A0A926IIK5_9FIRM|nr:FtsW/RodA/SpoVE family cell cycle protein [Youxingia wuxianensis]MBC8585778.1 FtsW/RodA/SpoVE family cell cycle protein [Youxingia wuxianensis]